MSKRPSIYSAFSAVSAPEQIPPAPSEPPPRPSNRVPAGVIGVTGKTLSDIRQERDDLRTQLAAAGGSRDLDPELIDPSPFPDRLADAGDTGFISLKKLIEEEGQKVPIQVRAHPSKTGRFQVVFGHRRWRASKELGRKVRAEIVKATDEELAVAQGIENSARQDLSWIERALFAWRLEEGGIKAKDIRAALAVDDAELARFRGVCRALPRDVIEAIGRAPKIGRPRWAELAKLAGKEADVAAIRKTLSADKVSEAGSDERFRAALAAVTAEKHTAGATVHQLKLHDKRTVGTLNAQGDALRLTMQDDHADELADFMARELPALIERFHAERRKE